MCTFSPFIQNLFNEHHKYDDVERAICVNEQVHGVSRKGRRKTPLYNKIVSLFKGEN
jgi:hypothetical protein